MNYPENHWVGSNIIWKFSLEAAFGLRREEAIKFAPSWADRGDRIVVKASTAKGGRARNVPILKDNQRKLLDDARRLARGGAMIPRHRNYAEQKKVHEDRTKAGGPRSHAWFEALFRTPDYSELAPDIRQKSRDFSGIEHG